MEKFEFSERVKLYLRNLNVIRMIKEVEKELPEEIYRLFKYIGEKSSEWRPKELIWKCESFLYFYKEEWEYQKDDPLCFKLSKEGTRLCIGIYVPKQIAKKVSPIIREKLRDIKNGYTVRKGDEWPIYKYIDFPLDTDDQTELINQIIEGFKRLFTKIKDIDDILKQAGILKKQ